jgi:hypothetical protein
MLWIIGPDPADHRPVFDDQNHADVLRVDVLLAVDVTVDRHYPSVQRIEIVDPPNPEVRLRMRLTASEVFPFSKGAAVDAIKRLPAL